MVHNQVIFVDNQSFDDIIYTKLDLRPSSIQSSVLLFTPHFKPKSLIHKTKCCP